MIESLAYGALAGAPFIVTTWFASPPVRQILTLTALVAMLSIYVGGHLTSSAPDRILIEVTFALVVSGLGLLAYRRSPRLLSLLVFAHGGYDLLLGPEAGLPAWYPAFCAGFDFAVGTALFLMTFNRQKD